MFEVVYTYPFEMSMDFGHLSQRSLWTRANEESGREDYEA